MWVVTNKRQKKKTVKEEKDLPSVHKSWCDTNPANLA